MDERFADDATRGHARAMRCPPVAARQGGAFTQWQAREYGFARDTIRRRLADGRWRALLPEVYVVENALITPVTSAWAGHLATGGVVAYGTAAAVHGISDSDSRIHVVSRRDLHVAVDGVVEHRTRLPADDVTDRQGLPITSRLRTLVDLLATEPPGGATRLLFRAVQQGWVDRPTLEQQIARRRGMTGNVQLRSLVKLLGTGAHSVAERTLHGLLDGIAGLRYVANAPISAAGRDVVVDVLLPEHGIVIEVDGRQFHSDAKTFVHDRRRQNDLVAAGYIVLRFTWLDLVERPGIVIRDVLRAIAVSSDARTRRTGP